MRYVCMDALELEDEDRGTRETIERAEGLVAAAKRDLRADFVGRRRLPLTAEHHPLLDGIDWEETEAARQRLLGFFSKYRGRPEVLRLARPT